MCHSQLLLTIVEQVSQPMNDVRGGLRRPVLAVLGFVGLLGLSSALGVTNRDHHWQLELPV
jgi:hypothetical protein